MSAERKPASITSMLRSNRSGVSLRIHSSRAVEIDIGVELSALSASGITSAIGCFTNLQIMKPMVAFQNPITIQGRVKANKMRIAICAAGGTLGPSARCMSHMRRMKVLIANVAKIIRRSLIANTVGLFTKFPNERLTLTYTID